MVLRHFILGIFFSLISFAIQGEVIDIKIYFNENWVVCKEEKAKYYRIGQWDTQNEYFYGQFSDFTIQNKKISEGNYIEGKKEGAFVELYESGQIKSAGFYKQNNPDGIWTWYSEEGKKKLEIGFSENSFEINNIYDSNGILSTSISEQMQFEFQIDTSGAMGVVYGEISNGTKNGKWSIYQKEVLVGIDYYKNGEYSKSKRKVNGEFQVRTQPIITYPIFEPFSYYSIEKLVIQNDVEQEEYPFLKKHFLWQPLDYATGVINDSTIFNLDKSPKYINGREGLNMALGGLIQFPMNVRQKVEKLGRVYFDILIDSEGTAIGVNITKSPDELLNDLVIDAVKKLPPFKPAIHEGKPINSKVTSTFNFKMN